MTPMTDQEALAVLDAEIASLPTMAAMATGPHGVKCDAEEAVRRLTQARAHIAARLGSGEVVGELVPDKNSPPEELWAAIYRLNAIAYRFEDGKPWMHVAAKLRMATQPATLGEGEAVAWDEHDRKRFEQAPCFVCGYNGQGYYQPNTHPCAAKYHPQPAAVSEAEVGAAARALCHSDGWHWETRSPERRKSYQRTARAALTAARAAKGEG